MAARTSCVNSLNIHKIAQTPHSLSAMEGSGDAMQTPRSPVLPAHPPVEDAATGQWTCIRVRLPPKPTKRNAKPIRSGRAMGQLMHGGNRLEAGSK